MVNAYGHDQRATENGKLFMGVELEVETGHLAAHRLSNAVDALMGNTVSCKHDSSIRGGGFEIVTVPMTLQNQKATWAKFLAGSFVGEMKSWDSVGQSCGMHVHVSRARFTPAQVEAIEEFILNPAHRQQIVKLAGRTGNQYCKYNRSVYDRYVAVNVTNRHTIEFRIFRGTLKAEHLLANIEFCHAVSMFVRYRSGRTWQALVDHILTEKGRKLYPNLIRFMGLDAAANQVAA